MLSTKLQCAAVLIVGILLGLYLPGLLQRDGFQDLPGPCDSCGQVSPCSCNNPKPRRPICPACPECKQPDMSKYVLKSSIPPCPAVPDMSNYILKSECPPVPDLSNYVLKSSIPRQQPVVLDCSKCQKPKGDCPPCPRARCPEVKCPEPTKCAPCAPCSRQSCPPAVVKCKAENAVDDSLVRPYLAPMSFRGFGSV
jgi:hypothetical protein